MRPIRFAPARLRNAVQHAANLLNAGFSPALIGGSERATQDESFIAAVKEIAASRGYEAYVEGAGIYLRRAV